jgi:tricorn protease
MASPSTQGYLRFPSISGGTVAFVTEDDLWTVPAEGGTARRLTADLLGIAHPVVSPDSSSIALTSELHGQAEIYAVPVAGGMAKRLTWLGAPGRRPGLVAGGATKVLSWTRGGEIVFASDAGQAFSALTPAYAIGTDGAQPPVPLPYGPVRDVSFGPGEALVLGRNTADPAIWKRYRGGTAGALWIDRSGTGDFELLLRPESLGGNLASPMWVGERIFFLSDHEGVGNLYSCTLEGRDVRRHTDHREHYARLAKSDGRRVVYQVAASLWLYDPSTDSSKEISVQLGSPRTHRQPHFVDAERHLEHYALDETGERLLLGSRGKLYSFAPWDGPVSQLGLAQGARYRLPRFLGPGSDVLVVSDTRGYEALEVHRSGGGAGGLKEVLDAPGLGRVLELEPSPDGTQAAVANHKNQLVVVPVGSGESRVIDESGFGKISGLTWSSDGHWLAYSFPASNRASQIKLANVATGETAAVTAPEFRDRCPTFSPEGKYLYFLSARTFNPVYDSIFFDLGFPLGSKPYLVTLQADAPSPFLIRPAPAKPEPATKDGRGAGGNANAGAGGGNGDEGAARSTPGGDAGDLAREPVRIDLQGISTRVVAVPVPEARYERIFALADKLVMLSRPVEGALAHDWPEAAPAANGTIEVYDLVEDHRETLLSAVADFALSGDRERLAITTSPEKGHAGRLLRIVAAATKPDPEAAKEPPGRRSGFVDLSRVRVRVDPPAEWAQMLREAWRLQPEHFWAEDLSGVDWQKVLDRYLPLVDLLATRSELSDLIWEMQGELGTSHSYELGGEYKPAPPWGQAHLGADLRRDPDGRWVVDNIVAGSSWDDKEASPLCTPGAQIQRGAAIVAVNGQPVDATAGPGPLLANQAGLPVELAVVGPPGAAGDAGGAGEQAGSGDAGGGERPGAGGEAAGAGAGGEAGGAGGAAAGAGAGGEAGGAGGAAAGAGAGGEAGGAGGAAAGAGAGSMGARRVVVPTLRDERPLRYRAWVQANRLKVREATAGRAGYLHIPDMMAPGWAEFHRSYLSEMERDALAVDARFNSGGHVSGLILAKLARRRIGWDVHRWGQPVGYPPEAPLGPLVPLTNEWAGSDGDIFTHSWKMLGLGPVVGTRTWGGVIGIELNQVLVDGTITTQPEYAFWFDDAGWGIENHGAEPDEEVLVRPQDYAGGRDPQLDRAIDLLNKALDAYMVPRPDPTTRPLKALPTLPSKA